MKKLRRVLVILLAITMILSTVPWLTFADGEGETDPASGDPAYNKVVESGQVESRQFKIIWNDSNSASRPDITEVHYDLYCKVNGGEGTKATKTFLEKTIGLSDADSSEKGDFNDGSVIFESATTSDWLFVKKLPSRYIVHYKDAAGNENNELKETYELAWYLVPVGNVDGYTREPINIIAGDRTEYSPDSPSTNETPATQMTEIISGEGKPHKYFIQWNDNKNLFNTRIEENAFSSNFKLYYSVDESETRTELNSESMAAIGMESMPVKSVDCAESVWTYTYSLPDVFTLAKKELDPSVSPESDGYPEYIETERENHTLHWYLETGSVDGYTDNNPGNIEVNNTKVYVLERDAEVITVSHDNSSEKKFAINWNDYNNERDSRPETSEINAHYKLYCKVDGGTDIEVDNDFLASIGMTETEINSIIKTDGTIVDFQVTSGVSTWEYKPKLPSKYTVKTETRDESVSEESIDYPSYTTAEVSHNLTWYLVQDFGDDNYIDENPGNVNVNGIKTYTLVSDYDAKVKWQDNENFYNKRPSLNDKIKVYRYITGSNDTPTCINPNGEDVFELIDTSKPSEYEIVLKKQPAYTSDGDPYTYYCVIDSNNTESNELSVVNPDMEGNYSNDKYAFEYENKDNYAKVTDTLYNNGEVTITLEGKGVFSVHKKWDDNNSTERPSCTLYLYRIAEGSGGAISEEMVEKAGPVQGFDKAAVPTDSDEIDIIMLDENSQSDLPMYDIYGHRYIYFVLERGVGGDYKRAIDNSSSTYADNVKSVFAGIKGDYKRDGTDEKYEKYVLNGGQITNILKETTSITGTKIFKAQAMQSMTAAVELTLQMKNSEGEWVNVKVGDLPNKENDPKKDDVITAVMEGFCSESRGQSVNSPELRKYTDDGRKIEYRWIETRMKIENDTWVTVPDDYSLVNMGWTGPGIGDNRTTAYYQPSVNSDGDIINTLKADTEILITKTWSENGKDITESVESPAYFKIFRDGTPLTVAEYQALRDRGIALSDDEQAVKLTQYDYNESSKKWEKLISELPRYDENGREYEYSVKEVPVDGWGTDFEVHKKVVSKETASEVTEKVIQLQYEYTNTKGEGNNLRIDVEKEWLDEGDLLTRHPVTVGVFRKEDNMQVAIATLNVENNWYARIYFGSKTLNSVDDYYVKEISVNDIEPTYTVDLRNDYDMDKPVGTLTEVDNPSMTSDLNLTYSYDVMIKRNRAIGATADYTISNRRIGVLSLDLTKSWVAGGDAPDGTFEITRSSKGKKDNEFKIDFTLSKDDPASATETKTVDGTYIVTIAKTPNFESTEKSYHVNISGLPKYDLDGNQYEYTIVETKIGGVNVHERKAAVEGDTYLSNVFQSKVTYAGDAKHHSGDIYEWNATNTRVESYDMNAYKVWRDEGTAAVVDSRPDIYFDLYRVAVDDATYYSTFFASDQLDENGKPKTGEKPDASKIADYCAINNGEKVLEDKLWNTKHNKWCWSCKIGTMPRYDGNGNRYIYYVKEDFSGSSGEYEIGYSNSTEHPNTTKNIAGTDTPLRTTQDVFGDQNIYRNVCVIADGYSKNEDGKLGEYYSRTVVNTRDNTRTLSGKKIWKLPAGWKMTTSDMAPITMELYRTIEEIPEEKTHNREAFLREAFLASADPITPVATYVLSGGNTSFKFEKYSKDGVETDLEKYDEYGRKYNYYVIENYTTGKFKLENYVDEVAHTSTTGYTITNTYSMTSDDPRVEIPVSKTWKTTLKNAAGTPIETKDMKPVTYELWAKASDGTGEAVKMNTVTLSPTGDTSEETKSDTFKTYNPSLVSIDDSSGNHYLPYYAPNGKPLKYYVVENGLGNGYKKENPASGYDFTHPVTLTANSDVTVYTGSTGGTANASVGYTNTYNGGTKDLSVEKIWANDSNWSNASYRPAVTFEIYRKIGNDAATDEKYAEVTITGESSGYSYGPFDNSGSTVSRTDAWKAKLNNLPKYNVEGKEYTYYIKSEKYSDNKYDVMYDKTITNSKVTNTFKTVDVKAKKTWVRDDTGAELTQTDLHLLHALGYLPDSMTFTLERKSGTADYNQVPTAEVSTSEITKTWEQFDEIGTIAWNKLPKYDKDGNEYTYRVVEKVGSFDLASSNSTVTKTDTMTSGYKSVEGEVTLESDGTIAFNNTVQMKAYKLKKVWDDNSNCDNTRPGEIVITVKCPDAECTNDAHTGKEYKLVTSDKNSENFDEWIKTVTLPELESGVVYQITEAEIKYQRYDKNTEGKYTATVAWDDDECTVTNTMTDRLGITLNATKTILGEAVNSAYLDKDLFSNWLEANRPTIKYVLFAKNRDTEGESWIEVTEANKADFGIGTDEAAAKEVEISKNALTGAVSGSVTWDGIYKYWTVPTVKGVPDPITYKIEERMYFGDTLISTSEVTADTDGYTVDKTANGVTGNTDNVVSYNTSITNTLKTTKVTAEKIWNDGDNKNRPEKIVFNLSADGTKIASLEASEATSWKAEFTDLPVMNKKGAKIKYDISEITPPGYFVSKKEVNEAGDAFKLTNSLIPPTGDVVFYKTGLMNEKCSTSGLYPVDSTVNVNGAKFELQTASGSVVATAVSKEGTVKFTGVSPGTYFVKEVSAPELYVAGTEKYKVTVNSGASAELYTEDGKTKIKNNTVINDIARADITLTKVAESSKSMTFSGAKFGLYRDGECITTAVTGKNGTLKFEGLAAGKEYRIVELEAPEGAFLSKNDITFEVDKNGKITNLYDGGGTVTCDASGNMTWKDAVTRVEIIKKDKNGTVLSGAKLAIKDKNTGKTILKFTTDGSEYDVTGVLEPGMSYILSELSAPTGYLKADDVSFSIPMKSMAPGDNKVIRVTMTDPYDPEYFNPDGTPSYIPDDDDDLNQDGILDKFQGDPNGDGGLFDDDDSTGTDDASAKGTKTGDATDMIPYASLMFTALLEMICLLIYRRRRENN